MHNPLRATLGAIALTVSLGAPSLAADYSGTHVGALYATTTGTGKSAVILVPGLACGGWVWDDTVKTFAKNHTVVTVTLAGFDGAPPIAGPNRFDTYVTSLATLIRQMHLQKPVVVGHSMGGALALQLAALDPNLVGGVVIVDSLPLFPPLRPGETIDARKTSLAPLTAGMKAQSDADFAAAAHKSVAAMVTNPATADSIAERTLKSDRATVAESFYELATTDLHPQLAKISVPVLVLAAGDDGYPTAATQQFYTTQYAGTPHVTIETIENARHFIMIDQPATFQSELAGFLAKQ